ncbi:MAG: hypothetical protein FWE16_05470 [Firmicutes bacterium]|nr:hypothetical protein [Bacillota bacterium]
MGCLKLNHTNQNLNNSGFVLYDYSQQTHHDDTGVIGMNLRGNDYFFRRNIFGDVIAIYNSAGTLMGTYSYDAWGNHTCYAWDAPGSVTRWNPFRWRGKFWDEETGFYYMHSRYYDDPQTGRFINADDPRMLFATATMGTANGGSNLFAYALNNPIMYYDPTGYIPSLIFRGITDFFVGLYETVVGIFTGDEETLVRIALAPTQPGGVTRWNPFRWRGKFWDEETGFYYMHSRFYDPQTGRFINADDPLINQLGHAT